MIGETAPPRAETLRRVKAIRGADGRLGADGAPLDELARAIEADAQLVVFSSAYTAGEMHALREAILDWSKATEPWPQGVSASAKAMNFHRVDDGSIKGRMAHIFHQFGFGLLEELGEPLRSQMGRVSTEVFDLQNRLAGTAFPQGTPEFRMKAIRHPRGGGYLVPHTHPYLPQKVAVFLNLSEPGIDYQTGGVRFRLGDGSWFDTLEDFRCGDLLAWRYSMVHESAPVDPDAAIDWEAGDGMWLFAMEWVGVHDDSNAVGD